MNCENIWPTDRVADTTMCAEISLRFSDYLDHTLPPLVRQGVAGHLRECTACLREVRDLACTRSHLRRLPRATMPLSLKSTLLHAFRTAHTPA